MTAVVVAELPPFDTGQYERSEFLMRGGDATLTLHIAELSEVVLHFERVRWHQFTALYNCTPEMIKDAYFKLVEYPSSPELKVFLRQDSATRKAYTRLGHYRIFLDETGCHEVFAQSAAVL
jgi:hypothetical protein